MARLTRAVGVLFSLFLLCSCLGHRQERVVQEAAKDSQSGLNIFLLDSMASDKIGRMELGTIGEGEIIEGSFLVENGFDDPLTIIDVRGSCGCLSQEVDLKPIMSTEKRQVTFYFDSKGKHGRQIVAVILECSSGRYRVEIDVNVKR